VRHRRLITLIFATTAISIGYSPAASGDFGTNPSDDAGTITAEVSVTTGAGGGGGGPRCQWVVRHDVGIPDVVSNAPATWPRTAPNGDVFDLYEKRCPGEDSAWVEVLRQDPQADLLPLALRDLKQKKLPTPEPQFLALDAEFGWAYVTVPVDFRVGNGLAPVSVTASIGPVWATVTAAPSKVTFDPGEPAGHTVSCSAAGAAAGYDPAIPGECSYAYVDSSAISSNGRSFTTTMGVEWSISWTSSTGAGGALPAFTTSSSAPLAVAEIQALVTCTGPRPEQGGCG